MEVVDQPLFVPPPETTLSETVSPGMAVLVSDGVAIEVHPEQWIWYCWVPAGARLSMMKYGIYWGTRLVAGGKTRWPN